MSRNALLAALAVLALPAAPLAHDRDDFDYDEEWGYIDEPSQVSVEMDAPGASVTFETFEENLAPHGEWVSVGSYGRVWRPRHVASGWRPYYDGSWQWTDEGWLWVSNEPWGWATYHYGRWAFDPFYGWVWVPGYQWAPAWVSWRIGADYIGWAPLAPGLSVYVTSYPVVYDHWCFVPTTRFVAVPVPTVAYHGRHRVSPIWSTTQPAPPRARVYGAPAPAWGGPARPYVERRVGRPITPVRVQPVATPQAVGAAPRGGAVPIFRPEVARPTQRGGVTAPARPHAGAAAPAPGAAPFAPGRSGGSAGVLPSRPDHDRDDGPGRSGAAPGHTGAAPGRGGGAPAVSSSPQRDVQREQRDSQREHRGEHRDHGPWGTSRRAESPAVAPPAAAPPPAAPAPSAAPPPSRRENAPRAQSSRSDDSPRAAPPAPAPSRGSYGGGESRGNYGGGESRGNYGGGEGRGHGGGTAAPQRR